VSIAAFLDANVLYSTTWRSILMYLAAFGAFRPMWSEAVHDEWTAALLQNRPDLHPARIARTRALMDAYVNNATVTGYEPLIATLTLPDPNDRHVLAAAIHGGANIIVTANLKDFPGTVLTPYHVTAQHPDTFMRGLIDDDPHSAAMAFAADRAAMLNPPMTVSEYAAMLAASDLPLTVAALRDVAHTI